MAVQVTARSGELYEQDLYAWSGAQADLLRRRRFSELDLARIAEARPLTASPRAALALLQRLEGSRPTGMPRPLRPTTRMRGLPLPARRRIPTLTRKGC